MDETDEWRSRRHAAMDARGYRESTVAPCPMRVAGKMCRGDLGRSCMCDEHPRVLDHATIWVRNRRRLLMAEPYQVPGDDVSAFLEAVEQLGLKAYVRGHSYWNPRATLRIEVLAE